MFELASRVDGCSVGLFITSGSLCAYHHRDGICFFCVSDVMFSWLAASLPLSRSDTASANQILLDNFAFSLLIYLKSSRNGKFRLRHSAFLAVLIRRLLGDPVENLG